MQDQVVRVLEGEGNAVFLHGRFDTAMAFQRRRGTVAFRLSATNGQQIDLAVATAHANEIKDLERWLHLDK